LHIAVLEKKAMLRTNSFREYDDLYTELGEGLSCSTRYLRHGIDDDDTGSPDMLAYDKGRILFIEGDRPRGVYILKEGRVKLTTSTPDGRVLILSVAVPGDTLGLSAVLTRNEFEATAEAIDQVVVQFIPKDAYLAKLKRDPSLALKAAAELGRRYRESHAMMRSLSSNDPVLSRLARLFLRWASEGMDTIADTPSGNGKGPLQLHNTFTHQQIAEMIGSSRETVTRVLREMRERHLVTLKGADLCIHSPAKLTMLATGGPDQYCDARHEARVS
jgi:CRP/FNR family transcriptional regulator